MRLKDNPFYILGVTPCDTVDVITEAAENKKFDDDENEQIYEEARSILVSPVKRLDAEIRYPIEYAGDDTFDYRSIDDVVESVKKGNSYADLTFDYDLSNVIIDIEQLYCENKENMQYVIEHLDYSYREAFEDEEFDMVLEEINLSREVSEFPRCDRDAIVGVIRTLKGDVQSGINDLFKRFDIDYSITLANDVAEYLVNQEKSYGDVLEIFLSEYAIAVSEVLSSRKEKVLELIEEARNYSTIDELADLEKAVRDFDYVAQPLQLLLRDRGQSNFQKESVDVAKAIRDLAIYYFNEHRLSSMSLYLTELEIELFSELTEFLETIENDKKLLSKTVEYDTVWNEYLECSSYLENNVKHENGYEKSNAQIIMATMSRIQSIVAKLEKCLNKSHSVEEISLQEMSVIIANVYLKFGAICTWGDLWNEAQSFYKKALGYSKNVSNKQLTQTIIERMQYVIEQDYAKQNNGALLREDLVPAEKKVESTNDSTNDSTNVTTAQPHIDYSSQQRNNQSNQSGEDHSVSGALIGGAIGAAVGGPVGAVVGGFIGRWLGKK